MASAITGPTFGMTTRKGFDLMCKLGGWPNKFRVAELREFTRKMKPRKRRPQCATR